MLDGDKLFKFLVNSPELKNIPIIYITIVAKCLIKALNTDECYLKIEE